MRCSCCGKILAVIWNGRSNRYEPISKYWKAAEMEETYCGARCSLLNHEPNRHKKTHISKTSTLIDISGD